MPKYNHFWPLFSSCKKFFEYVKCEFQKTQNESILESAKVLTAQIELKKLNFLLARGDDSLYKQNSSYHRLNVSLILIDNVVLVTILMCETFDGGE